MSTAPCTRFLKCTGRSRCQKISRPFGLGRKKYPIQFLRVHKDDTDNVFDSFYGIETSVIFSLGGNDTAEKLIDG